MRPIVVFDTNVLFSAVGWDGRPSQCVHLARESRIEGVTCTEILNELAEKLFLRLEFSNGQVTQIIGSFLAFLRPVTITGQMNGLCPDPKDDMILECAIVAGATHLVTSDKRHLLPLRQFRGIQIVTSFELLGLVEPTTA
jgi:putative PIN family toxin of toxin-antitoxin system